MPASPTHKPAGDDGRPADRPPTVTDKIRAKLREQVKNQVDHNGSPLPPPAAPQPSGADELAAARADLEQARADLAALREGTQR